MDGDDNLSPTSIAAEADIEGKQMRNGVLAHHATRTDIIKEESVSRSGSPNTARSISSTHSVGQSEKPSDSLHTMKDDDEKTVGGDVILKYEPFQTPKLARTASQKIRSRPAPLFHSFADKTKEAQDTFTVISGCIYSNKSIGSTEQAMECDCAEEWGKTIAASAISN